MRNEFEKGMTGTLRIRSRGSHSTVGKFEKSVSHKLPHLLRLLCSTDLQATGEAAKVHSTSDRTYPSLTTTERQEAQRAKFCKYVIQDTVNSDNYPITAAECLNPERRQMTLLESIFPIGPYSRYFQLFHGTWNKHFEKQ